MADTWEMIDVYKALLATAAGAILGMERELKDKAAGLKTITVICLGSALFAIISYKIGSPEGESTRIASYIVSGIGFLGAGVIFKDQLNVSGLTTAGIIWLAAAIGTAIGFGEFYLAGIFMAATLLVVYCSPLVNSIFKPAKQTRLLTIVIFKNNWHQKENILAAIAKECARVEEKKLEAKDDKLIITIEAVVNLKRIKLLQEYLVGNSLIEAFSF